MDDNELIHALRAAKKRAKEAPPTEPADARELSAIADAVVRSYEPARTRAHRWRSIVVGASAGIALAASVVLFVRAPQGGLPQYEVATFGGARDFRGEIDGQVPEPARVRKGDHFQVAIQPESPVKGPVAARALLVRGAQVIPFTGVVEVRAAGAARIRASVDDFPGAGPGRWEVVLIVARPDALGEPGNIPAEGPNRRIRRVAIDIE